MAAPRNQRRLSKENRQIVRAVVWEWHRASRTREPKTLAALAKQLGISPCYASRIRSRLAMTLSQVLDRGEKIVLARYDEVVAKVVELALEGDLWAQEFYFKKIVRRYQKHSTK